MSSADVAAGIEKVFAGVSDASGFDASRLRARERWLAVPLPTGESEVRRLRERVAELELAAAKVVFFRNRDGSFVDGWRAQECLNELAALGLPTWPSNVEEPEPVTPQGAD